MIYLDTHVVVWLFAGRVDLLPSAARDRIDAEDVLISPMAALELQYLYEAGKTSVPADPVLLALEREIGLRQCDLPFADVAGVARQQTWTRDPFDRIVVAHSVIRRAPLLTRDRTIHAHHDGAVWEG